MAIASNPILPDTPKGAVRHPTIQNACALDDGTVLTYDPRLKTPEWCVSKGIMNTHGRRQSQIAKKMRLHYQIVYESLADAVARRDMHLKETSNGA